MLGFQRVLVAIDPGYLDENVLSSNPADHPSHNAMETAIWLAGQTNGELHFVSVLEPLPPRIAKFIEEEFPDESSTRSEMETVLEQMVQRSQQAGAQASAKVLEGQPWRVLVEYAQQEKYDLLIAGTRWKSGIERFLFGSTGLKLLRHCPCPVWLTRTPPHLDDGVLDILVAVDFDSIGESLLRVAVGMGQALDARLHILHAVQDPYRVSASLAGWPREKRAEFEKRMVADAEQELLQLLDQTDHRTLTHGIKPIVDMGRPDEVILRYAEQAKVDLLVMGTRGRSGLGALLLGSTAERLFPQTPCSVLALKPEFME